MLMSKGTRTSAFKRIFFSCVPRLDSNPLTLIFELNNAVSLLRFLCHQIWSLSRSYHVLVIHFVSKLQFDTLRNAITRNYPVMAFDYSRAASSAGPPNRRQPQLGIGLLLIAKDTASSTTRHGFKAP